MIPVYKKPLYVPALRMKQGELQGLEKLATDVAELTLPLLIIPPRTDRNEQLQSFFKDTENTPAAGILLAKHWSGRTALLDMQYLFAEYGEQRCEIWLPQAFDLARRNRVQAVPVASVSNLLGARKVAYANAISIRGPLKLALRIESAELVISDARDQILRALDGLNLTCEQVIVIADFADSDFSDPELVSGVIEGAIQQLEEIGPWYAVVFQGTNYPEHNKAPHGGDILVPRNEWKSWAKAVGFEMGTSDHIVFGDYAADSAKMIFGASGGRAIRHYRYTTPTDWFVVRGNETGSDGTIMRDVCRRIVASKHFSGAPFSRADRYIFDTARGEAGPGNSTTWREINTTHHITQVVRDIGKLKGLQFDNIKVRQIEQMQLF